jgi:2-polyprenyl-3-methyl-5-hydroxy-6-metoxy-1,4-benzoquinol methylase
VNDKAEFNHVFDQKLERCLVCGEEHLADHITDWRNVLISRCSNCSFQFMNPQYDADYIHQFYIDAYADDEASKHHGARHEQIYSFYLDLVERYKSPGSLLDIGCGDGNLLAVARQRGWQISGYDVDDNSTKAVSDRLDGASIFTGDFLALEESIRYDVITLHQVLEHVKNPNEYLQKLRKLLTNDGYVFVAVPNIRSFSNSVKAFLEHVGIRKKNIGKYYDTYHHLLYFTPPTLRKLLTKHGFTPVYTGNCLKTSVGESKLSKMLKRYVIGHFFPPAAFFVIAKID